MMVADLLYISGDRARSFSVKMSVTEVVTTGALAFLRQGMPTRAEECMGACDVRSNTEEPYQLLYLVLAIDVSVANEM